MQLCSIGELATMLGVAVITLRRWHAAGTLIPACRTLGGHRRYDLTAVRGIVGLDVQTEKLTIAYAVLASVRFAYGAEQLRHALAQQTLRASSKSSLLGVARAAAKEVEKSAPPLPEGEKKAPVTISQKAIQGGIAITWRFMRQADGSWRISFSTDVAAAPLVTSRLLGAIGVDINCGFISVAETDRFGNILSAINIVCPETGRSAGQRAAARGDAVKQVIEMCRRTGKPMVLEALDFKAKKRIVKG